VAIPVGTLTKYQNVSLTLSFSASLSELAFPNLGVEVDSNPTTIVDPVPDLVNPSGDGVVTDAETLATYGTPVTGVAADSATRVVFRVPTNSVGERLTFQLLNDQGGQSSSAQADGTLATIQGSAAGSQMQVTAVQTSLGPMAFCLYFPPEDFSRGGGDDSAAQRSVKLQARSVDNPTYVVSTSVTILRPPVLLVHGIWDGPEAWDFFTPLNNDRTKSDWLQPGTDSVALSILDSDTA
jgi:hypothetical protein